MEHPERAMPFCVKRYRVLNDQGECVALVESNHQTRNIITLPQTIHTQSLTIEPLETWGCPAAIFEVRCYA